MYLILILTVVIVAGGVFFTVYTLTYNAMVNDIRDRAAGIKDFIIQNLYVDDFRDIGENTEDGVRASEHVHEVLGWLKGTSNLTRLYIAKENEAGELLMSLRVLNDPDSNYVPSGALLSDLRLSLREGVAVMGSGMYRNDHGGVYSIYWPVHDADQSIIGTVGMEFNANIVYTSLRQAAIYSLVLSAALLVLISIVAYLSMSRVTESTYKRLAYTDILTGYENRMAFEHKLRECGDLADQGKSITLIICDVNNLKVINDTIGHKAGDAYIKNTADLIAKNIGEGQPIYRIGGDEIASIIVGKRENEIEAIMQSLRNEKRSTYKNRPFSCACGAATFIKGTDETLRDTFKRADEAMYVEKKRQKGEANIR